MNNIILEQLECNFEGDIFIGKADVQVRHKAAQKDDGFIVALVDFKGNTRQFGGVDITELTVRSAITDFDVERESYETLYSFSEKDNERLKLSIQRNVRNKLFPSQTSIIERNIISAISAEWDGRSLPPVDLSFCFDSNVVRLDFKNKHNDLVKIMLACPMDDKHFNILATGDEAVCTAKVMISEMELIEVLVVNNGCETISLEAYNYVDLENFTRTMIQAMIDERFIERSGRGVVEKELLIFNDGELCRAPMKPSNAIKRPELEEEETAFARWVREKTESEDNERHAFSASIHGVKKEAGAKLKNIDLHDTKVFGNAAAALTLERVIARNVTISDNMSWQVHLSECEINDCRVYGGSYGDADFKSLIIRNSCMIGVKLIALRMKYSVLLKTTINHCELKGVDFTGAKLVDVTFLSPKSFKVDFTGATLVDCKFIDTDLSEACFKEAILVDCDTDSPAFDNVDLSTAIIKNKSSSQDTTQTN